MGDISQHTLWGILCAVWEDICSHGGGGRIQATLRTMHVHTSTEIYTYFILHLPRTSHRPQIRRTEIELGVRALIRSNPCKARSDPPLRLPPSLTCLALLLLHPLQNVVLGCVRLSRTYQWLDLCWRGMTVLLGCAPSTYAELHSSLEGVLVGSDVACMALVDSAKTWSRTRQR